MSLLSVVNRCYEDLVLYVFVRRLCYCYYKRLKMNLLRSSASITLRFNRHFSLSSNLCEEQTEKYLEYFSAFNPSPVSLQHLLEFGKRQNACEKSSYQFLRKEIPVRLANIMKEINLLPTNLLKQPSVQTVDQWYRQSLKELVKFSDKKDDNSEDVTVLKAFMDTMKRVRNRHSTVVETMAEGILELKESYNVDAVGQNSIQYFLDRFYMSRISIRTLVNQHILLFGNEPTSRPRYIGSIDPSCDVLSAIEDAYHDAKFLCEQYYMVAPELQVELVNHSNPGEALQIVYVPSHLHHMLFELFKNAMRAVVETHGKNETTSRLPHVQVTCVMITHDVSIKVSDRGGGIPLDEMQHLFLYMYSTAPKPSRDAGMVPLAGYGYGLPLSRLYARYFHGDLQLYSMHGLGTDALIYLKTMCSQANEVLPVFNKATSLRYEVPSHSHDWSSSQFPGSTMYTNSSSS